MSGPVVLETQVSYDNILVSSENKLLYLLTEVVPSEDLTAESAAINLAVVLDKSGSMYSAEKMNYVIEAVEHLIDQLRPKDILSVIIFADEAKVVIPAGVVEDPQAAKDIIRNIHKADIGSGTEMLKGIDAAIDEISGNLSREMTNHCILLTDGLTLHEKKCRTRCEEGARSGISFSTIGVGNDFNENFLLDIANACRGKSYYIDVSKNISAIFAQELAGVQSVMVLNPKLELKLSQGVEIRRIYRVKPLINEVFAVSTINNVASIDLQNLQKDEAQSVLFELSLPSRRAGAYRIAQAKISYEIPSRGMEQGAIENDIVVKYTVDSKSSSQVNPGVIHVVDLVSVFCQQARALQCAQEGDSDKATRLLHSAATTLLQHGQKDLAEQALEEVKHLEREGQVSAEGAKKLEYGTRNLTQILSSVTVPPA